jgi:Fe2+ transport system protein B
MSCSARIPVYTLLIALVIPNKTLFHFFNLQGLVLFALYALGLFAALLVAFILKQTIKTKEKGYLPLFDLRSCSSRSCAITLALAISIDHSASLTSKSSRGLTCHNSANLAAEIT